MRTNSPRADGVGARLEGRELGEERGGEARVPVERRLEERPLRRHRLLARERLLQATRYADVAASLGPPRPLSPVSRRVVAPALPAREAGTATPRWLDTANPLFVAAPAGRDAARMAAAERGAMASG